MPPARSLQRGDIVDAAIAILESEGVAGLSMRRLAARLDSKPMTLYPYVGNKSTLLSLALSEVAARIDWTTPTGPPRERMVTIGMDMFVRLGEIPWIVSILQQGTNIGTPALGLADRFFDAAHEAGLDDRQAFETWRGVWYLIVSELQYRGAVAARGPDEQSWFETIDPADVADLPHVTRILPHWPDLSGGFDVRRTVENQVDGAIARAARD
ncbi:TetR/AcrR family transcriptional regulator [Gordonia sp. VNK21]|uniref:TetR/AcrR family transcriptional regulator n=1 Tax=Gordonia sp. VNK21 TaxID=3382483 RepID=UPI0038D4206D